MSENTFHDIFLILFNSILYNIFLVVVVFFLAVCVPNPFAGMFTLLPVLQFTPNTGLTLTPLRVPHVPVHPCDVTNKIQAYNV